MRTEEEKECSLESPPLPRGVAPCRVGAWLGEGQEGPCSIAPAHSSKGQGKTWPRVACSHLPFMGRQDRLAHGSFMILSLDPNAAAGKPRQSRYQNTGSDQAARNVGLFPGTTCG
ncbi:UNVERIFIED_CONTAM: hypothetical protein K2H54_061938 [Gekko kuhli]